MSLKNFVEQSGEGDLRKKELPVPERNESHRPLEIELPYVRYCEIGYTDEIKKNYGDSERPFEAELPYFLGEENSTDKIEKNEGSEIIETDSTEDALDKIENIDIAKNCPVENGSWQGERGKSKWIPDMEYIPQKKNPEQKNWKEILKEYEIDGINFEDGEAVFDEISKGDVEIEAFSTNRDDNFDKADIELAKQKGCTPEEVSKWRKENGYTWHECRDMKTMQKVPGIVHNNVSHRGGISEAKGR